MITMKIPEFVSDRERGVDIAKKETDKAVLYSSILDCQQGNIAAFTNFIEKTSEGIERTKEYQSLPKEIKKIITEADYKKLSEKYFNPI